MFAQPCLARTVVVPRHMQQSGCAGVGGSSAQLHCGFGVVAARARDDGLVDGLDHCGCQVDLLVVGEGRALPCGAGDDQTVAAALGGEVAGEFLCAPEIQRPVRAERCDHGGQYPPEACLHLARLHLACLHLACLHPVIVPRLSVDRFPFVIFRHDQCLPGLFAGSVRRVCSPGLGTRPRCDSRRRLVRIKP